MLVPIVTYIISKITAKTIAEVDLPLYWRETPCSSKQLLQGESSKGFVKLHSKFVCLYMEAFGNAPQY